jgi:hypothetical protein
MEKNTGRCGFIAPLRLLAHRSSIPQANEPAGSVLLPCSGIRKIVPSGGGVCSAAASRLPLFDRRGRVVYKQRGANISRAFPSRLQR